MKDFSTKIVKLYSGRTVTICLKWGYLTHEFLESYVKKDFKIMIKIFFKSYLNLISKTKNNVILIGLAVIEVVIIYCESKQ